VREVVSSDEPPWLEVTTDHYMPRNFPDSYSGAAWVASTEYLRDLLQRQHDGEFRLRLVLREVVDFKSYPSRDPRWFWDYSHGPDLVLSAAEIVIETRDGRRRRVDLRGTRAEAFAAPTFRA
jgi:hypothetical protein